MTTEKAIECAENYARGEWEDNRTSFDSLTAEVEKTTARPDGGENYHVAVSALISDDFDGDTRAEEMKLIVRFDQGGRPVFSNVEATRFRDED